MEVGSGSSSKRQNSGQRRCHCDLPAMITQAGTDKNPGRRFYGCPRYKLGNECKYFCWFDEEEGTKWQKRALIEARDEIREKNRVIEQLKKTISQLRQRVTVNEKTKLFGSLKNSMFKLWYSMCDLVFLLSLMYEYG
ncbi:unnamed protein product [Eruca vesicaria subsp. sativa]|uniref:GRF-type domain-containing protein n=1 Tax=Eruca vesicaria subsp. sativa TaxID=29727 RepID=A0ABC8J4L7_ERUVS|nr:unnamed protein product [Eruca vesicaria subsp. sativa]